MFIAHLSVYGYTVLKCLSLARLWKHESRLNLSWSFSFSFYGSWPQIDKKVDPGEGLALSPG
jgi:hypothetical protein